MENQVKKTIIPAGGFGTRFLPLSKVVSKELLPLVDEPMIAHIVREAVFSGMSDVIFVLPPNKKSTLDYFKSKPALENLLKKANKKDLLNTIEKIQQETENTNISYVTQTIPRGDGDAVLKAEKKIGNHPFAVAFCDDIFVSKKPAIEQLKKIYETSNNPVIGLKKVTQDKVSSYGTAKVEKIAKRLYKIKGIIEKPTIAEAPSDLVFCGRYVFTPEIFKYIKKTAPNKKGEIILAESLKNMLGDGKIIYGYELEGEWLECGKKEDWIKSNLYLTLKHPKYGPMVKEYLKKMK